MSSNTTNQDDRVFHDEGLTRKLGLSTAIAIGIGTTVGSGIFTSIGEIAGASGSALFIAVSIAVATASISAVKSKLLIPRPTPAETFSPTGFTRSEGE